MPFRVTELCQRLLEASHNPAKVIRQMRAGLLGDVIGQAVKGSGHGTGDTSKRIGISAETDGRSHCTQSWNSDATTKARGTVPAAEISRPPPRLSVRSGLRS